MTRRAIPTLEFEPADRMIREIEIQRISEEHPVLSMPIHAHHFFEFILITEGSGIHLVDGRPILVAPGQLFVVPPGVSHDCRGMRGVKGWVLMFTRCAVDDGFLRDYGEWGDVPRHPLFAVFLSEAGGTHCMALANPDFVNIEKKLDEIFREQIQARPGHVQAMQSILRLILVDLLRLYAPSGEPSDESRMDPLIANALSIVNSDFKNSLRVHEIANRLDVTPEYLTTRVRQATGRALNMWILERRMAEARRLLEQSDMKVVEVAHHLGYMHDETFVRQFVKRFGIPPGRWRRNNPVTSTKSQV